MSKIRKLALAGNILLAGLTILSYLSKVVDSESAGWISMLGLVYSALVLGHFLFFFGWLAFSTKKYAFISALFLVLEFCVFNSWFQISIVSDINTETTLTAGTLNLQFAKSLSTLPPNTHDQYLKLTDKLEKLDILCVQELGDFSTRYIDFPYQHVLAGEHVGIYSNHPIVNRGTVASTFNSANNCLWADILYQDDTIRVYSAHLESNRHDGLIPTFVDQNEEEDRTTSGYSGLLTHYLKFSKIRRDQAIDIRAHQRSTTHPFLIAGDFNDVPLSAVYTNISAGLKDSFIEKGMGSGSTMSGIIPGLRIDYILTSQDWEVMDHDIVKDTYSDHYLVTARLELRQGGSTL